jgi:excisionase family DNA binding protein
VTSPIEDAIHLAAAEGAARAVIDTVIPAVLEAIDRHPAPLAVSTTVAAEMIGVSERTVDELIRSGELPRLGGVGRRRLIPTKALEEWVENNTPAPVSVLRQGEELAS